MQGTVCFLFWKTVTKSLQVPNRGAASRGHCWQSRGNKSWCGILDSVLLYVQQWWWEAKGH